MGSPRTVLSIAVVLAAALALVAARPRSGGTADLVDEGPSPRSAVVSGPASEPLVPAATPRPAGLDRTGPPRPPAEVVVRRPNAPAEFVIDLPVDPPPPPPVPVAVDLSGALDRDPTTLRLALEEIALGADPGSIEPSTLLTLSIEHPEADVRASALDALLGLETVDGVELAWQWDRFDPGQKHRIAWWAIDAGPAGVPLALRLAEESDPALSTLAALVAG